MLLELVRSPQLGLYRSREPIAWDSTSASISIRIKEDPNCRYRHEEVDAGRILQNVGDGNQSYALRWCEVRKHTGVDALRTVLYPAWSTPTTPGNKRWPLKSSTQRS